MALRVGLLDISALGVAVVAIILPPRAQPVDPLYAEPQTSRTLAALQADLVRDPKDGAAAQRLAEALSDADQSDWALRVAGQAAVNAQGAPTGWRALLAVSAIHADRLEIKDAADWAEKSLGACDAQGAACLPHERVRLQTYATALRTGVESGIDPRVDPRGFADAVTAKLPTVRVRPPKKPKTAPK